MEKKRKQKERRGWHAFGSFWTQTCWTVKTCWTLYCDAGLRPWPSFKVTGVQESRNSCTSYFTKVWVRFFFFLHGIWRCIETCWSEEPHFFWTVFKRENFTNMKHSSVCFCLINKTFHICLSLDTYELDFLKFSMMVDSVELSSLIPVSVTLIFSQGHWVMKKLKLMQSFCWKVTWSSPNFNDGWLFGGSP